MFIELGAKVICAEPLEICGAKLNELFGDNGNVTIVSKAVGEKEGSEEMAICEDLPALSTLSKRWEKESVHAKKYDRKWTRTVRVPVTTLDKLIAQYGVPAFCKIDVEGFEEQVFNGLSAPIKAISFEFNPGFLDEAKNCIRRISEIGRYKFNYATGEPSGDGLVLKEWASAEVFMEKMDTLYSAAPDVWGDVYAELGSRGSG